MAFPKRIGRYDIFDELGQGTMGSVFRARDPAIGRIVAIKTILSAALTSGQDEESRQRFYREARAAGALAHPGIVPIFDVGEHEGVPFLVMEFVDGQTLVEVMKRRERRSLDQTCEICQGIAEALGYAHRQGVIHRDIKPVNILMTSRQTYGEERPKIADFGVAKLTADQLTSTGKFLGTPAFMPPEQFTGDPIDGRTDLFSLGVILYWMATGEQPFPGETISTVSYKIVHTEPVPPARLNPAVSTALDAVILKSLAKSPSDRFQSGEEFAEVLARLRTAPAATHLIMASPKTVIPTGESQQTLDFAQSLPSQPDGFPISMAAAQPHTPASQAKAERKPTALALGVIGLLALFAVAGGGYLAVRKKQAVLPSPSPVNAVNSHPGPDSSRTAPTNAATTASSDHSLAGTSRPASTSGGDSSKSAFDPTATSTTARRPATGSATKPAASGAASQPISAVVPLSGTAWAARQSVAVPFDPKKLDPQKSTRLKIDFSHVPADAAVSVEMDGQVFFKGSAGNKPDYDNLYAPPGMHEFRVTVGGSHLSKTSNIVSAEFVAKKHMSLKLELRPQPKDGASSLELDPSTQVIATLKVDRFLF